MAQTNSDWLKQRLSYIRGLQKPTQQQELLLLLDGKQDKTDDDERKLAALAKAERADERAAAAKADLKRIMDAESGPHERPETGSFTRWQGCSLWQVWWIPKPESRLSTRRNYWERWPVWPMLRLGIHGGQNGGKRERPCWLVATMNNRKNPVSPKSNW